MTMDQIIERRSVISGAGQSDVGRRLFRDPLELTLDACLAAIDDVEIGMPVQVTFEARDEDVWIPLFEPAPEAPA